MNVLSGLALFLVIAFATIVLSLLNILPLNYLGGFVIGGFIGGLLLFYFNAWRQGDKLLKSSSASGEISSIESLKNYPCLKEIVTGSREGQACVFSADCERVALCNIENVSTTR